MVIKQGGEEKNVQGYLRAANNCASSNFYVELLLQPEICRSEIKGREKQWKN